MAFFIFIFAGFSPDVGREMSQREEFSYPDSDVWKASDRAEENMPEEYWLIFQIVMGNSLESEDHNTLKMDVFRKRSSEMIIFEQITLQVNILMLNLIGKLHKTNFLQYGNCRYSSLDYE